MPWSSPCPKEAASEEYISQVTDELIRSENILGRNIIAGLNLAPSMESQIIEQVAIGKILKQHWHSFGSYDRWSDLQEYYFLPRVKKVVQFLTKQVNLPEEASIWIKSHQEKLGAALGAIASRYLQEAAEKSKQIKALVSSVDEDWSQAATLSQMGVRARRSTLGITTVLVGMRRESYVDDMLEELGRPVTREHRTASWRKLRDKKS